MGSLERSLKALTKLIHSQMQAKNLQFQAMLYNFTPIYAQVAHSRTGRRISHGYNQASFMAICIGPQLFVLYPLSYVVVLNHTYIVHPYRTTEIGFFGVIREI